MTNSKRIEQRKGGDRHTTPRNGNRHKTGYVRPPRPQRIKESKFYKAPFIAWDGEGANVLDVYKSHVYTHRYVLLMNSVGGIVKAPEGLSTVACFRHLLQCSSEYPEAIHVVYGGSYDSNMMLKDIPIELLRKLHAGERIIWKYSLKEVYSIEYRARRELFIGLFAPKRFTAKTDKKGNTSYVANYIHTIRLWDVFGFFQGSFLGALSKYFNTQELSELSYSLIKQGKDRRSDFSPQELDHFIIPYTTLECKALVALMTRLREHLVAANISLSRWDGAGAVAASVLKTRKIKEHFQELPPDVMNAARRAYSGGRIEAMKYGYLAPTQDIQIYHDDLISAYPSAMPDLPSMLGGQWKHAVGHDLLPITSSPWAIFNVSWSFPDRDYLPFYPFFVRYQDGSIYYPYRGRNWIYSPEMYAALAAIPDLPDYMRISEIYQFMPDNDVKPFAFVQELFNWRKLLKEQGDGAEKVFKLAYNSFYGKLAQHLGYTQGGHIPPFFNLFYAGLITSITRSKLFRAAMGAPHNIIAFSTDGIWSTSKLELQRGSNLGNWEHDELRGILLAQSGVYWSYLSDDSVSHFSRGFDKDALTPQLILDAWAKGQTMVEIPTTRFVTLGSALASEERFYSKWRSWDTRPRKLEIRAIGKRQDITDCRNGGPALGLVPTRASTAPMLTPMYDVHDSKHPYNEYYPLSWPIDVPWLDENSIAVVRADKELDEQIGIEIEESTF
jgi:DNA polymerase type B, organellar and viral